MTTLTITRISHASVLIDFAGYRVLTDPWFSEKFGYYHGEPYGIALENLPPLDGVVVSHGHYDHYDMQAFQAYPDKQVPMAVKRGIAQAARKVGFTNVIDMDAWETTIVGPITVTAAPGKHGVPEITYLLQAFGLTVYFGGDTLLIPALSEIPRRFGQVDVALLAINGLKLRTTLAALPVVGRTLKRETHEAGGQQVVMNALDAAELCRILQPRYAVPIHYTFTGGPIMDKLVLKYTGTPQALLREFKLAVAKLAPETTVRVLAPGEPFLITPDGDSQGKVEQG